MYGAPGTRRSCEFDRDWQADEEAHVDLDADLIFGNMR